MSLKGWEDLACHVCGEKDFTAVFHLQFQQGLGTTPRPAGYQCVACRAIVDQARMVATAKKREAEQKIKELEAEIGRGV
jgi:hypothetical protein